jgi:hypothetical protein
MAVPKIAPRYNFESKTQALAPAAACQACQSMINFGDDSK